MMAEVSRFPNVIERTTMPIALTAIYIAPLLMFLSSAISAAEPPPVRPGLWEISVSGPSISERIKTTPADKLKSMEQVAGITIRGDAMVRRVCITPEMLAQGISIKNRPDCEFKQQWKGKATKISFQCPNGNAGKGELNYPNKENYKGWIDSGRSNTPENTKKKNRVLHSGKWMAKDCGAKNN
jgi:hypothetical protein